MKLKAYAKINLRLKVLNKRENGYHDLEMINARINLFDEIEVIKNATNALVFENTYLNPKKDSLIMQLVEYMQEEYKISDRLKIIVTKNIPIGAGLGGGSADCACLIHYLNETYNLQLTLVQMNEIGLKYGADIPYCLYNKTCIVKGIGEIIEPVNLTIKDPLLVVYPNIHLATKDVFQQNKIYSLRTNTYELSNYDFCENDLEQSAFNVAPELAGVKKYLETFPFKKVVMSGSGSSFICFSDAKDIEYIYQEIKKAKDWFVSNQNIYEV